MYGPHPWPRHGRCGKSQAPPSEDNQKKFEMASSMLTSLHQPIEDIGFSFLLSSYIADSHFEYLPTLSKVATSDGPLTACARAVGLASISHDMRRPEVMEKARHQYSQALSITNKALQSPKKALLDETLAAVMLLSLFELVSHQDQESSNKWASHINGALSLLVLRGSTQFKSTMGMLMFTQISSNIRVNCVQRRLRMPPDLLFLMSQASPVVDAANPNMRFGGFAAIVDAFTNLRADIEDGHITEPASIIRTAREVDERARVLASNLPAACLYDIVDLSTNDAAVFDKKYHIYKDHRVAQQWNTIRMTRLLLHEIIYDNLIRPELPSYLSLCNHFTQSARHMASEILASVPQFTEFSPMGNPLFSATIASSCFLIWPLELVASSPLSTTSMRVYAIGRLRYMGVEMKVRQALEVVEKLEQGSRSQSQDW
jgi:Fungal specific transcription factor domain